MNALTNTFMSSVATDGSSTASILTNDVLLQSTTFCTSYYIGWILTSINVSLAIFVSSSIT